MASAALTITARREALWVQGRAVKARTDTADAMSQGDTLLQQGEISSAAQRGQNAVGRQEA